MPRRIPVLLALTILWCARPLYAAPTISNVICPSSAAMYDKLEMTFDVDTVATNLFWPYETNTPTSITPGVGVTVEGVFSKDNWTTSVTVPAFYYQEYSRRLVAGTGTSYNDEANTPVGVPHWCLRFAPTQTGMWLYKIRVTDSSGTTTYPASGDTSFRCTTSTSHGFVRVSPTDSRYFELSDGKPIISVGVNAPNFHSTYEADSLLKTYGENGVQTARYWMTYRGWQNPFAGGDYPTSGGSQWQFSLTLSSAGGYKSSDRYAAQLSVGKDTKQSVYLTAGVLYRFTGYIKTDAVVAAAGQGIIPYINTSKATAATGINGWTAFTVSYTPSSSGSYLVGVRNTGTSGVGYFDDLSLRSSTDGGTTWSGEYLSKPDLDTQNYVDMKEAWKVDRIFESAKQNGVYLKTVITEKQDSVLGRIGSDGSTVAQSDDNFYASASHPSRWLQKAWWRYATARWSAYTSVHSWELCNEGDPFSGNHYNAASALADYVDAVDPNSHLCTTSFWHSIPMEFWKASSCDYLDVHEYIGPTTPGAGSHGPRFYAWYDGMTSEGNSVLLPMDVTGGRWSIDDATAYSGSRSTKLIAYTGNTGGGTFETYTRQYHVGIDPSHKYTVRFWAKADNIGSAGGSVSWVRPGIKITWSKAYHENDWVGEQRVNANLGTYDWTHFAGTGIVPTATANTANINIVCTRRPLGEEGDGIFWVDDIELIDETTEENVFVDGGIEGDRIDYDTALAIRKYGVLATSYGKRIGKPVLWGETGIRGANVYGTPYKGYSYTEENQQLVDDTGGVYLKKMIWAHLSYGNPNMLLWWTENIAGKNLWPLFKAFQNFIANVPLSNGRYVDANTSSTHPNLRAWGQKDLTNKSAVLWVDNSKHTWKNVVDGVSIPAVSGTVTVTGLADGPYKVEWWNTSTGVVTGTDSVQCTAGSISLVISGLATDKACKIYQDDSSPPSGGISINGGADTTTSTLVTLTLSATDADSGVSMMRFSNDNSVWTDWEAYGTSKEWNLSDGDGVRTVYVQYMNGGQTISPWYNDSILADSTQPSGTIIINSGAASTSSTAVILTLAATDATSGVAQMRFSDDGATWSTWESYGTSRSWTLPSGDGAKTVYAQYMDAAGNVSLSCSDSIILGVAMPDGSVSASAGAEYIGSASVTLTVSDGGGGAVQMRFSNDGATWSTWQTYATSKSWTLSSGDGTKTAYAQFKNSYGTTSTPCSDTIVLDTSVPIGTISVNAGAQYSNSTSVTVMASVSDTGSGLSQMRFSNDNSTWSTWESYASSKSWALTSGNGTRTVYAQFKDTIGNTSSSLTDAITLDTIAPTGTVSINSGTTYATSTSATLTLSATDSGSAVAQMRFSNDDSTWNTWESYGTSKAWTLTSDDGTKTVYVQYKDGAGNTCANCTDTIILTNSGPTGTITINAGDEYVKTVSVALTLSAYEGLTSVTQMRLSNDGTTWSTWQTYATSKSWTLASGNGTKTVYVQYKDEVGRTSSSCTDTIILDTSVPTVSIVFPTDSADYYSNHPSLTVSGTAAADVTGLTWSSDSGDSGSCSGITSWETQEIALAEGANVITITANDAAGNSVTRSITLHRVNVHTPNTWVSSMMVSVPLIPDESDPKAALGFDGTAWCIFRPIQNDYVGYGDDPEHLTWLDPAAATPGRGFWARFVEPATTPLGEIPDQNQPATIHLYPGWNIIGTPFLSPVTWDVTQITIREVGNAQKTLAKSRGVMDDFAFGWRRTEGGGAYYIVYDSNISPGIDNTLEPWMAYWVQVYRECDITFPAPPSIF